MLTFLFLAFVGYLLFRLVFDFIIPIYRTTKKVKESFQEMKQKMNEQTNGNPSQTSSHTNSDKKKKQPLGDYIDFEEVKD